MAFWEAVRKGKAATEPDNPIRRYTETVMQMLQRAHERGQDSLDGNVKLGMQNGNGRKNDDSASRGTSYLRRKYSDGKAAYWDAEYAAPKAMHQHGFCRAASRKYGSHGSQRTAKPSEEYLDPQAAPLSDDASYSTPTADYINQDPERRIKWKGVPDVFDANVGSRYLDEAEAAKKGERIVVLDSRATVQNTVLDDIAAKKTLRKLSTLTALLEKQKRSVQMQDTVRLPRVAMVTLKARRRIYYPRNQPPAVPSILPEDCVPC